MSVIDRFLNAMKMNDDDDVSEDDYLDDEDDEDDLDLMDEEPQRRRILSRRSSSGSALDDDDDGVSNESTSVTSSRTTKQRQQRSPKITSIRGSGASSSSRKSGMEVCVIRPKSIEDAREITDTLLDECTVILNFEGIDFELSQRIIDFACGSTYAIHGNLQKVSNYIFIITPESVDISGDIQEMVSGMYDVPTFDSNY